MARIPRTDGVPDFEQIPNGEYRLTVLSTEDLFDRNGDPYIRIRFQVDGRDKPYSENYHLTEKWLWKIKKLLIAIDESLTEKELDTDELIGKSIMATIEKRGKYSNITKYEKVENSIPVEETAEDLPF